MLFLLSCAFVVVRVLEDLTHSSNMYIAFKYLFYCLIFCFHCYHVSIKLIRVIVQILSICRMLHYFIGVHSIYTCFISLYLKIFKIPLPLYVVIIGTIVNGFFMLDIILSFFVMYVDKKTIAVVDNMKTTFWNVAIATDVCFTLLLCFIIVYKILGFSLPIQIF